MGARVGLALSQLLTIIAFLIVLGALSALLFACPDVVKEVADPNEIKQLSAEVQT